MVRVLDQLRSEQDASRKQMVENYLDPIINRLKSCVDDRAEDSATIKQLREQLENQRQQLKALMDDRAERRMSESTVDMAPRPETKQRNAKRVGKGKHKAAQCEAGR